MTHFICLPLHMWDGSHLLRIATGHLTEMRGGVPHFLSLVGLLGMALFQESSEVVAILLITDYLLSTLTFFQKEIYIEKFRWSPVQ